MTDDQTIKKNFKPLPVVAIGASAGGIQAIKELLENLSPETGLAYIYIQHLDPVFESKLTEILQRETKMKVQEVSDYIKLEPNHIYVIPPNKEMDMIDGAIRLKPRNAGPGLHMPIDHFFLSLAEKYQDASIGIVLSGSASDGTLGLKAIKTAGGITIAQDETAQFQGMPRSAISEGVVDMVLRPSEMAKELERLSRKTEIMNQIFYSKDDTEIGDDDKDLTGILHLLKKSTSVDFFHYKMKTIKRRIIRRMLLHRLDSLSEYLVYVKQHAEEIDLLYQDLLINVTSFFRDSDTLEYL
ncbi:MAG: chemotaxis protein CheB, partial [Flavisolibacter sp.]